MTEAKTKVVLMVRAGFERHGWWHPLLGQWLISLSSEKRYQVGMGFVDGVNGLAASANVAADAFLAEPGAEWFGLVDNDVVPPGNMLRILDDLPDFVGIISPLCHMMRPDGVCPQAGSYRKEEWEEVGTFYPLEVQEPLGRKPVDRVGGGCWFVRRCVFEAMEPPYFRQEFDPLTFACVMTDDVYFQHRAHKLGFMAVCDTRFTALHYHTINLAG